MVGMKDDVKDIPDNPVFTPASISTMIKVMEKEMTNFGAVFGE